VTDADENIADPPVKLDYAPLDPSEIIAGAGTSVVRLIIGWFLANALAVSIPAFQSDAVGADAAAWICAFLANGIVFLGAISYLHHVWRVAGSWTLIVYLSLGVLLPVAGWFGDPHVARFMWSLKNM
jgi:hypothetical protein